MIYWVFGQTGAGKTTYAKKLMNELPIRIHLDGDEMRQVWPGLGLSTEDRAEQNRRIARLAHLLESQGHSIVVSTICPYRWLREEVTVICAPIWIYMPGGLPIDDDHPFEPPVPD